MRPNSYFKVRARGEPARRARFFFFHTADEISSMVAYMHAVRVSTDDTFISVWATPQKAGPWDSVRLIGEFPDVGAK